MMTAKPITKRMGSQDGGNNSCQETQEKGLLPLFFYLEVINLELDWKMLAQQLPNHMFFFV